MSVAITIEHHHHCHQQQQLTVNQDVGNCVHIAGRLVILQAFFRHVLNVKQDY